MKAREVIANSVCMFANRPFSSLGKAERQRRLDEADFVLLALKASGFAIVPKEPSERMIEAGTEAASNHPSWANYNALKDGYTAMLQAAKEEG